MRRFLRYIPLLAILLLLVQFLPNQANAASSSDLTFTLNPDGVSYSVTDCNASANGELMIPATYNGYPVSGIDYKAFSFCSSLTSVTIPNSVTSIGSLAFWYCDSLNSVTIPDSVTSIDKRAFLFCSSLTGIWVDENNTVYSSDACGALFNKAKTVLIQAPSGIQGSYTISDSVTSIDESAFRGCSSLIGIWVDENNTAYSSDDCGVLFNKAKTVLIQAPGGIQGSYSIPNSVTSIGMLAFEHCRSLTSVTISDSVTSIGDDAFYDCASLSSITIPDSVIRIGDNAFMECTSLTSVVIGDNVTSIGEHAFDYCDSLTSVTIPESVTSIGRLAFYGCTSLTGIWVDENNTAYSSDDYGVLFNKAKTVLIQAPGGIQGDYVIPNNVISVGEVAFEICRSLTSVTIPDSVICIGDWAFWVCNSLTDVYYNGTLEQWNAISIASYNDPLLNATLHCMWFEELEGGTLKLLRDTTIEEWTLEAGKNLDLNGHILTVDSLVSFGQIIDSVGTGGLMAGDIVIDENDWLPIQDSTGCYRFYEYKVTTLGTKSGNNRVTFGFALEFTDTAAYTTLLESQDVQIAVTLAVGERAQIYAFSRELICRYANLRITYPNLQAVMMLKVTGIDSVADGTVVTVTPEITAVNGKLSKLVTAITYIA